MHNIGTTRRDAIKGLLAISASGALAACSGAKDGNASAAKSANTASELSAANMVTLTAVVDTIIPATDTGGAIAAGVPATLASLVKDWGDDKFKAYWTAGIGKVKDDFYKDMKQTAATAYYMSEIGASEELAYEPVPGEWIGCVPLSDYPKTWAT